MSKRYLNKKQNVYVKIDSDGFYFLPSISLHNAVNYRRGDHVLAINFLCFSVGIYFEGKNHEL